MTLLVLGSGGMILYLASGRIAISVLGAYTKDAFLVRDYTQRIPSRGAGLTRCYYLLLLVIILCKDLFMRTV